MTFLRPGEKDWIEKEFPDKQKLFDVFDYKDGNLFRSINGKKAGWLNANGYISLSLKNRKCLAHRIIFYMFNGYIPRTIDHVDGDKLNNRAENLRECDHSQNAANRNQYSHATSSMFKGVTWSNSSGKWRATLKHRDVNYHLGMFVDEVSAAKAYDKKALEIHGEYALVNFPESIGAK